MQCPRWMSLEDRDTRRVRAGGDAGCIIQMLLLSGWPTQTLHPPPASLPAFPRPGFLLPVLPSGRRHLLLLNTPLWVIRCWRLA